MNAAASGDQKAQTVLTEVTGVVERHGVPGTKFAASLADMHPGRCRLPLQPLGPQAKRSIVEAVEDMQTRFISDT